VIDKLILYQKTYDLYLYTHKFIKKFPKSERLLISFTLRESLLESIKLMVRANLKKGKKERLVYQEEIEVQLMTYLTALRLSRDLNFLPKKKYQHASFLVNEIIKILYGWKKSKKEN